MSVLTEHEESPQPFDAEELVRSLAEEPPISPEFRSRVLAAATEAAGTSTRRKGWVIAAGFSALCAACVLMVAVLNWNGPPESGNGMADDNPSARPNGDELIHRAIEGPEGEIITGGMAN